MSKFLSKVFALLMFTLLGLVFWMLLLQPFVRGHY